MLCKIQLFIMCWSQWSSEQHSLSFWILITVEYRWFLLKWGKKTQWNIIICFCVRGRLFSNSCSHPKKIIQSIVIVSLFHSNFLLIFFLFGLYFSSLGFRSIEKRNFETGYKIHKNYNEFLQIHPKCAKHNECIRIWARKMVPFLILPFKIIIIMYLILLLPNHLISLWKCRRTSIRRLYFCSFCAFFFFFLQCAIFFSSIVCGARMDEKGVSLFSIRYVGYVNALEKCWKCDDSTMRKRVRHTYYEVASLCAYFIQ